MVLNLTMPGLHQNITVKIIGEPYIKGDDVFLRVIMWGDPKKFEFEMKITKTMWHSTYRYLKSMEDDMFNKLLPEENKFKIDDNLSYLKDKVITVRGVSDRRGSGFVNKKTGILEYPKIFDIEFRNDLESIERGRKQEGDEGYKEGEEEYKKAVFKYVINNVACEDTRKANTYAAREEIAKLNEKKLKQDEKEKKKIEKEKIKKEKENNKDKIVAEWAIKKREKEEKEEKRQKKLGEFCGF